MSCQEALAHLRHFIGQCDHHVIVSGGEIESKPGYEFDPITFFSFSHLEIEVTKQR